MQAEEIYSVDGLPPEWGYTVAKFVESHAKRVEAVDGREGEYMATLTDAKLREQFTIHAKIYSRVLWDWVTKKAPKEIVDWALGNVEDNCGLNIRMRLHYLLFRHEQMVWWDLRGRLERTKENIRQNANRLKMSVRNLLIAAEIDDIQLFEHMVKEMRRNRSNKRSYQLEPLLVFYWMSWSLWKEGVTLDDMVSIFFRRLGIDYGRTTFGQLIIDLGLRPINK